MRNSSFFVLVVSSLVSGCSTHQSLVQPSTVSLRQALVDTVDALDAAREESLTRKTNFGFYGCTVTAAFNISASDTVGSKIALSATGGPPAAIAPVSVNLTGSREETEVGAKGNTVTVVLATPECLPNVKVEAAKSATGAKKQAGASAIKPSIPPVFLVPREPVIHRPL